ncbi:histidine triad nucleotide-binding protein [Pontibacter sp. JAM-7]|uniref:histidine triad nucleotide-binding protein n=1 Tax=Pontibacter sp. JAM-7 TaxID=3366581 RepID=UPI003AF4385B
MSACVFCRIARGEVVADVVYTDDQILAFKDHAPKAPVHLLVIPRRHVANLAELTPADADLMAHIMLCIPEIAAQAGLNSGFRTITNTGSGGRQEVYHMHFHILGGGRLPAM